MVDVQAGASGTASPAHRSRSFVALREPRLGARFAEEARLLLGLTNSAFAQQLGVSGPYLSLIRRGQRPLPPQLVQRIGRLLADAAA